MSAVPDHLLTALPKILEADNLLECCPPAEEIQLAMVVIGSLKAPGPDGFPSLFYTSGWATVGEEVTAFIQHIFDTTVVSDELKHTNLILIPKSKEADSPKDFRLISLCNVLYKVITKFLTARLRPLLDDLISPYQNAFVPGRQIVDNSVIAQELFHSMGKLPYLQSVFAFKIDMAKAYDRINWSFLSKVLIGFKHFVAGRRLRQ